MGKKPRVDFGESAAAFGARQAAQQEAAEEVVGGTAPFVDEQGRPTEAGRRYSNYYTYLALKHSFALKSADDPNWSEFMPETLSTQAITENFRNLQAQFPEAENAEELMHLMGYKKLTPNRWTIDRSDVEVSTSGGGTYPGRGASGRRRGSSYARGTVKRAGYSSPSGAVAYQPGLMRWRIGF
jgi:hypothetical protein